MIMFLMAAVAAGVIGGLDHNIVSPQWLQQNLDNPDVVVVEIGGSQSAEHPHIPGARYIPIDSIVTREGWPPDELPPVSDLRRAFENAGVGNDGRIILYSATPTLATRAWFTLDYLGQGDRTAILDGGWTRWVNEKRPIESHRIQRTAKTFTPHVDSTRVVSLAETRDALNSGAVFLDARSPYEFHGYQRGQNVARRGHIPGAHCDPWSSNYDVSGSFQPASQLRTKYENVIGNPNARVIVYCRTGMEASVPYFVLRSLGYNVALDDGAYAAWARDKSLPVTRLSPKP